MPHNRIFFHFVALVSYHIKILSKTGRVPARCRLWWHNSHCSVWQSKYFGYLPIIGTCWWTSHSYKCRAGSHLTASGNMKKICETITDDELLWYWVQQLTVVTLFDLKVIRRCSRWYACDTTCTVVPEPEVRETLAPTREGEGAIVSFCPLPHYQQRNL